ncbi:hypothetical protein C8R47DRAFT_1222152 [Mycena vitilis]|nr:hypothetical protein C8R47DRAFT_1222152 [Mycena vitilis]
MDTQLFLKHQCRSDALLAETHAEILGLEGQIADMGRGGEVLTRLASLRDRYSEISTKLQSIETKMGSIQTKLSSIQSRLTPKASDVEATKEKQEALNKRREVLQRRESALLHPLTMELFRAAPIRRVPGDVLLEIFAAAKSDAIEELGKGMLPALTQVCQQWRAVTHERPLFWASIAFSLKDLNLGAIRWLKLHLEKSVPVMLTIQVDATSNPNPRDPDRLPILRAAVNLIDAHSTRFHSFRLRGTEWDEIGLRRLSTTSGGPNKISLSQIRSLYLERGTPFNVNRFSNLTSLTWRLTRWHHGAWQYAHTTLPKVTTLQLDFGTGDLRSLDFATEQISIACFEHFTFPALKNLELVSLRQSSGFAGLIERSKCKLQSLVLRGCSMRVAEVKAIFELSSGLESLTVVDGFCTAVTDKILEPLTRYPGGNTLLPNLRRLRIDGRYAFRDQKLLEMLESRGAWGVLLDTVELRLSDRTVEAPDVQRLRALNGVSVSMACLNATKNLFKVI